MGLGLAGPVTLSGNVTVTGTFGDYIMSKMIDKIISIRTSLQVGENDTITVPAGATFDASSGTLTLQMVQ